MVLLFYNCREGRKVKRNRAAVLSISLRLAAVNLGRGFITSAEETGTQNRTAVHHRLKMVGPTMCHSFFDSIPSSIGLPLLDDHHHFRSKPSSIRFVAVGENKGEQDTEIGSLQGQTRFGE
ncbi:hypothetical protein NE237_031807 [Protea cynaroides]|uniref:Uncharacterized protein n=1 Tax=Protea cynaroides TaxID=273540 RepID=A0A9Q0R2Y2_9MAGN|nr:hypothetical protein NE237_031807 [Protea cynaroides]